MSTYGGNEHGDACAWFEEYLDMLGFDYQYEPDLGTTRTPDYLVTTPKGMIVCEVKAFSPNHMPSGEPYEKEMKSALATVRNSIRTAARQLRELAGKGIPLVIVLANPAEAHVLLDQIIAAMYGDPSVLFTGLSDGTTITQSVSTLNGKLRVDHPYVSGVLMLARRTHQQDALEQWQPPDDLDAHAEIFAAFKMYAESITANEQDAYLKVTYIEAPGLQATPLPEGLFTGEHAYRWRISAPNKVTLGRA